MVPGSRIPEGEYTFIQGGIEQFNEQPAVKWADLISWLIPQRSPVSSALSDADLSLLRKIKYRPEPKVLQLLASIENPRKDGKVQRIDYRTGAKLDGWFDTRSEAELALINGLVMAGWSFDQIQSLFDECQPGHYAGVPNQAKYLAVSYDKAVGYVCGRKKMKM